MLIAPFGGTAVHATEGLGQAWIAIDHTHLAVRLIEKRQRDALPTVWFTTHRVPPGIHAAHISARRADARRQGVLDL